MSANKNRDLVFVLGAGKTATTSLCGLLNSHPDVLMMCEVDFGESHVSRYGNRLVKAVPELLPCFFGAPGADWLESYRRAHEILRTKGFARSRFGDKLVGIDSGYAKAFKDTRVIYSVRRLPEWIGKDSVRAWFPLDLDVVPFATQYAKHFVESFLLPRVYHVRMEAFLKKNATVVREIWQFLELDPPERAEQWWETIGHYASGDPKGAMNWWRGHASSAVAPQDNDTQVQIRQNAFWAEILPVFNKYYDGVGQSFTRAEIEADLETLQGLIGRHHQPFETCFKAADSESRNARFKEERARKGSKKGVGRILRAIGLK